MIKDAVIDANAKIQAFTHIDQATVGAGSVIGPYARLRPGTVLAEEVHVGNFVEIKNSDVGAGSKANHLAYVGDATIGKKVNIGAGTITCNYDGDDLEIGFNSRFLLEMLSNIDADEIKLSMSEPSRAGLLTPATQENAHEDILMLVMPVMLNR